jgi:putative membrane protein
MEEEDRMNAKHFILGALVLAAPAFAHEPAPRSAQVEKLPRVDVDLLKKLHQANREEIELGQVAQQQSVRDDVRQFGKMMVDDHRMADEKITKMADAHAVPLGDDSDAMKLADKFREKTGDDFDRDYLSKMVKDHDKVISLVSTKQNDVKAQLQATLSDMLPTLRKHRMEAKRLLDEVKGKNTASARTRAQGRSNPVQR